MKGQIASEYIVNHAIVEVTHDYLGLKPWRLYFDDSIHKSGTRIGILIISPKEISTKFKFKIKGGCTNNEAGYETLTISLKFLLDLGEKGLEIKGDLELVVKQLTKE